MLTCPLCRSDRIHRSTRRGLFERKVLALLFLRPFRCDRCDHRFIRGLRTTAHPEALRAAPKPSSAANPSQS
jgi:hypothetical protein